MNSRTGNLSENYIEPDLGQNCCIETRSSSIDLPIRKNCDCNINNQGKSLIDVCRICNPTKPKKLSRSKKWFDKDCMNLKKDVRKLGRQKSKEPTNLVLREKYCVKLKQFRKNCKNKRYHFWQKQFNELEDTLKDSKSFWNKWKQSTDKYPTKPKIDISGENWYNHFHNLHTEKMINLSPTTFTNHHEPCDILNAPFTKDELQHAIDNLKNSKAAGFDGITNEMIKKLP